MREIKFRGKRIDNGEWVYGYVINFPQTQETLIGYFYAKNDNFLVDPATVGQYTGIKDKKGVEIYEGDIVTGRDALSEGFSFTGFVDHENGSFVIKSAIVTHYRWLDYILETIGNLHDSPDLLEVTE